MKGRVGFALEFDGVDDYVEVASSPSMNCTDAITIEAFVKTSASGVGGLLWKSGGLPYYASYGIMQFYGYRLAFLLRPADKSGESDALPLAADVFDGRWHHLAVTWNGKTMAFYADGKLCGVSSKVAKLATNDQPLFIGKGQKVEDSWFPHYFKGVLDEVRIYSRALSNEEVVEHYKSATPVEIVRFEERYLVNEGCAAFTAQLNVPAQRLQKLSLRASVLDRHGKGLSVERVNHVQSHVVSANLKLAGLPVEEPLTLKLELVQGGATVGEDERTFSLHRSYSGDSLIDLAYFSPDQPAPYKYRWTEGWRYEEQFFPRYSHLAGSFHVYLRNSSMQPLRVDGVLLNGQSLEELRADLQVPWWRVLPNPIPPGKVGEVTVRLRRPPKKVENEFAFEVDGERVRCVVSAVRAEVELAYVGFSADLRQIYVFVEQNSQRPLALSKAYLDGKDVTRKAKFYSPSFFRRFALVKVTLTNPLKLGDYHVVKVACREGPATAATVRVLSNFFPLAMFAFAPPEEFSRFNLNTAISFMGSTHPNYLDTLARFGYKSIPGATFQFDPASQSTNSEYIKKVKAHEAALAYWIWDEPDASDAVSSAYPSCCFKKKPEEIPLPNRLGIYVQHMEHLCKSLRELDSDTPSYLNVNFTYKPDNWYVYARIADIFSHDPYTHTLGEDPFLIYNTSELCRRANAPKPIYIIPDFCYQPSGSWQRAVEPEEARLRMYYCLAAGAKGIIWYVWSPAEVKGIDQPELQKEIAAVNAEAEMASPLLMRGCPVPVEWATSSHEKLWVKSLLCSDETVVVILVNRNYKATKDGFSHTTLRDTEVRISLPSWLRARKAFVVSSEKGFQPVPFERRGQEVAVRIESLEVASMLVLTANERLLSELRNEWERKVERRRKEEERVKAEKAQSRAYELAAIGNPNNRVACTDVFRAYGTNSKTLWNPLDEKENAVEWLAEKAGEQHGLVWRISVPQEVAGQEQVIGLNLAVGYGGNTLELSLLDADRHRIRSEMIRIGHWDRDFGDYEGSHIYFHWRVKFPRAGDYILQLMQAAHAWYPTSATVAKWIYLLPASK